MHFHMNILHVIVKIKAVFMNLHHLISSTNVMTKDGFYSSFNICTPNYFSMETKIATTSALKVIDPFTK